MTASPLRRALAWGVHAYTALGLPLSALAAVALYEGDVSRFFLTLGAAVFVDATDGVMARAVRVREVLPSFDGRKLDDLVDFLTFAFLPALAMVRFELFPPGLAWLAAVPLLASGYGFCQEHAKTEESFVGFPSYWNIVVLYLIALDAGPWANLAILLTLSALVFVPIHYVYPTKTRLLRPITVLGGAVWAVALLVVAVDPTGPWAFPVAVGSMVYPVYYAVLSLVHHRRVRAEAG